MKNEVLKNKICDLESSSEPKVEVESEIEFDGEKLDLENEECLDFADDIDRLRQEVGPSLKKNAEGQNGKNKDRSDSARNMNSNSEKKSEITFVDKKLLSEED